jgi:hypothetical protein
VAVAVASIQMAQMVVLVAVLHNQTVLVLREQDNRIKVLMAVLEMQTVLAAVAVQAKQAKMV